MALSGSVSAQEVTAAVELTNPNASIAVLGITVEQAIGSEVFDPDGQLLGTVTRVIGDDADSPTALVLDAAAGTRTIMLSGAELIENRIVATTSGEEMEHKAPFE